MDGVLRYQHRLGVPDLDDLETEIFDEAHGSIYSVHLGATKMYHYLQEVYWGNGLTKDIGKFVARCPNCQHIKAEHQRPPW